ncbi:MAG: 4Fe-4S binding protein [Bacteroidales bacterium]|jgi:NAD-dependent dihydropyrimidine dehydrogenase PreA subunit|nr:4Fe-4S binding protein [Bacteroidales bacterium]
MVYKISEADCVACGTCQNECPSGAISEGDVYHIDPDVCIGCGACADACPMGAIHPVEES